MTRPEDIPADVWTTAFDALHPLIQSEVTPSPFAHVLQVGMAKAILAERERCIAKLNAERVLPLYVDPSDAEASDIAYDTAIDHGIDAIRG